ncbi:MAG: flagellar filament capping protein FliD [Oscillospiraceae bacterium]|nr:flagellar filament capping protein FliD [Oscillospiraceae bacterium]
MIAPSSMNAATSGRMRMAGLASGLDTQEIVKGMTSGIRARIAKQIQAKQSIVWKMDAYRSISSKMVDFNNKYFSFSSSSNLLSNAFYRTINWNSTGANSDLVTVSGNSPTGGSLQITDIVSTATTASFVTTKDAGNTVITGNRDINFSNKNALGTTVFRNIGEEPSLRLELNGRVATINLPDANEYANLKEYANAIQAEVDKAFGANKIIVGKDIANGQMSGRMTFETVENTSILAIAGMSSNLVGTALGLTTGEANRIRGGSDIADILFADGKKYDFKAGDKFVFEINGTKVEIERELDEDGEPQNLTLNQIIDRINQSGAGVRIQYLATTNRFSVTSTEMGAGGKVDIKAFEDDENAAKFIESLFGQAGDGTDGTYAINEGKDAQIEIKYGTGETAIVTRSTNNFSLDGFNITLAIGAEDRFVRGEPDSAIRFESSSNADAMVESIKSLVDELNTIIQLVNREVGTRPNRNYFPLTAEQKSEMKDSEIEDWERQAKIGLLFGDSTLRGLSNELRFLFSPRSSGPDPRQFGFNVSTLYEDNGKVLIDEEALRKAIQENPDGLQDLFTGERGIMTELKGVVDKYASTAGVDFDAPYAAGQQRKGLLILQAGLDDSSTSTRNFLYRQLTQLDTVIERLQRTQQIQEDRYYKQFTALERHMVRMNEQSSWMAGQFGGQM